MDDRPDAAATTLSSPPDPAEEPASRLDDFVDIYIAPAEVFDRRRDGRWGLALIVLAIALTILTYAFMPATEIVTRAEMARAIADNPEMAEQAAQMESFGRSMRLFGGLFVPIVTALVVLLLAAVIRVLGAVFGVGVTFVQSLVVATFAHFVLIPRTIASSVALMLADRDNQVSLPADASFGPLRFVEVSDTLEPFLSRLDLFILWEAALWALGLYVIGRTTKGKAVAAAAVLLVLTAIPGLIGSFLS